MRLADFTLVEPFFREHGISPNWLYALAHGDTVVYDDGCILNSYVYDDVCYVNSGTLYNKFGRKILLDIKKLINTHDKIIISSSVISISRYMARLGFRYENNSYIRGV